MAYRQLCFVTFAMLGLWLPACGSGDVAGEVDPPKSDQPPASGDQAPPNSDQPPGNSDQPPGNSDQPPGNPDQPLGPQPGQPSPSTWEDECDDLCDEYGGAQECEANSASGALVRTICDHGCSVKQGEESCEATFVTAVKCVAGLSGLCTEAGPSAATAMTCQQAVSAAQACVLAAQPGGGDTCNTAGQCECEDDCASCKCALGASSAVCASLCD